MHGKITTHPFNARERVTVFLAFLTSEACRDACRRYVENEQLAAVLSRVWFDEIYVPGDRYLHGLKGDRSEEDVQHFWTCFTPDERATLERFHGCFELRLDLATNRAGGRAHFPDNDSWRSLLRDAAALLNDLDPDPDRLRMLLAGFINEVVGEQDAQTVLAAMHGKKLLGE
ncbi:MAG TPA: hypothetical protein VKP65_07820 [Rhodothermales bacterium]|nr:hypothetical protein [Rhodothermales bacterium]